MSSGARLVIAGVASGVGKTSLALGLARYFTRSGLRVQTFKVGPDFLDPTFLQRASERTCYNLDGWMTSRAYVRELFDRAAADADLAIVEGVMGLYDGASPRTLEGSTAEIAIWLDAPVLLVCGAHGVARSLAATVRGFADFEPQLRLAGVIANHGGSPRHRAWLAESLAASGTAPLLGMVPRGGLPPLASRHLGLVAADQAASIDATLDRSADACAAHLDCDAILCAARAARTAAETAAFRDQTGGTTSTTEMAAARVRLGVARDAAFSFYYADNFEALGRAGVDCVPFSPLSAARLPEDLDALYFGGGYPELHAAQLAANRPLLAEIRAFARSGRPVYGECGGMMYLGQGLTDREGHRHAMAGVLPAETEMLERVQTLGYAEATFAADALWGRAGATLRGHEFHYSRLRDDGPVGDDAIGISTAARDATEAVGRGSGAVSCGGNGIATAAPAWAPAYRVARRGAASTAGFLRGKVMAGYVHLHWASRAAAVEQFVEHCRSRT